MATQANTMVPLVGSDTEIMRTVTNIITMIDLTQTPIISSIPKTGMTRRVGTKIQYQQDKLKKVTYTSKPYGDKEVIRARNKPSIRHVHMETFHDAFSLSEESIATQYYGISNRWAYENRKHYLEMITAVERHFLTANVGGQAASAANGNKATTPMLESLISTNSVLGGVDNNATRGGWDAATSEHTSRTRAAGNNQKVYAITDLEDLALDIWEGQDIPSQARTVLMSRSIKEKHDSLGPARTLGDYRQMVQPGSMPSITTSVSTLHLLNGEALNFVPTKHMKDSKNVFLLNLKRLRILYYYWNRTKPLGATGVSRELLRWFTWTVTYEQEAGAGALLDRKAA